MFFTLNGEKKEYLGDPNLNLLTYLRNIERITSVKDGCSGQGACGACTVQVNDKALLSCRITMKSIENKKVVTPEGIEKKIQEAFAFAFSKAGGVQCGFCTPGIVMSAKILLMKNLDPSRSDIEKSLQKHICRCTGYKKIVDAISLAAKILSESNEDEKDYSWLDRGGVGVPTYKYKSDELILGKKKFVCDLYEDGMLYGVLKFSDYPRAKICSIDIKKASNISGVVKIFTAEDIPGKRYTGLIAKDWPLMIKRGETTRYIGDVLALVVAHDHEIAKKAVDEIEIKYKILKPLTTVDQAIASNASKIHPKGNLLSTSKVKIGNAKKALKESTFISKGTYYTQRVEHAYLETECCLAMPWKNSENKGITVFSQGQGVYEDQKTIAEILGIPKNKVRVVQVPNGGAFGGKEDLSVQGHAALASFLLDKPVQVRLDRKESLRMHPKRHPMRLKYQLGCDKHGKLTGLLCEIDGDTGAYASVGMKVLERAAGHAAGAYVVPNVEVTARAIYTNNIPCGAMRGFGVNQSAFAMEGCIDDLCLKAGIDRWQFRYDNAVREGEKVTTGQVLKGGIGLRDTLLAIKDEYYKNKYVGIACGIKNTGIGNGMPDIGESKIEIKSADHVIVHHGWTEMGQGIHTVAIQFVHQETGIDPKIIEVKVDTEGKTPCGMTTSSRGTSLVGNSLINASKKLKEDLENFSLEELVGKTYYGKWMCDWTSEIGKEKEGVGHETHYSYGYATQLVILDEKTGKIQKVVAAHDAGKIINPTLFEGQIEGAVHMGLGYALSENFPMKDGQVVFDNLGKLGILRIKDTPLVEVIGVEAFDPNGPYGAKGVGEIGIVPTAAAVANALFQFDKIKRYQLPIGISKRRVNVIHSD